MKEPAGRSLYVHFPWCVKKCPYCDFNSHPLKGPIEAENYVRQLLADLDADLDWAPRAPVATVFLGGGTPSLFNPKAIAMLLDGVARRTNLAPEVEVTLEANPGAVDRDHFAGYLDAGVNRLSIGAQSFDASMLSALGRIHSPHDINLAVDAAHKAGFPRINIDLMYGLPAQTLDGALADLDAAIRLGVSHLSWYQLTIEPRTEFARRPPTLPDEDHLAGIEAAGLARLEEAGFRRYEVSAHAQENAECRHNLNYWRFGDYLGIGAGAHGKVTFADADAIVRTAKPKAPSRYTGENPCNLRTTTAVPAQDRCCEFMMNVLRLTEGVEEPLFEAATGLPLDTVTPTLRQLRELGLLRSGRIGTTASGLRYLDSVIAAFA